MDSLGLGLVLLARAHLLPSISNALTFCIMAAVSQLHIGFPFPMT